MPDGSAVEVEQRVYRGELDAPKNGETRIVAVPPRTAALLVEWLRSAVDPEPNAWVFASENRQTPASAGQSASSLYSALAKVDLEWVDFKVMRRTNASLSHGAKVDPKVSADQRATESGCPLTYTKSNIQQKGVESPQRSSKIWVLGRKVVRMLKMKAS